MPNNKCANWEKFAPLSCYKIVAGVLLYQSSMEVAFSKEMKTAEDAVAAFNAATHAADSVQAHKLDQESNYFEDNDDNKLTNKRYACDTCGQSFTRKHNLKSHQQIHTKGKAFKCQDCSLTFRRGYDLKRHAKTHTKERPFQCSYCGKGFARADALLRHSNSSANCAVDESNGAEADTAIGEHNPDHQVLKKPKLKQRKPVSLEDEKVESQVHAVSEEPIEALNNSPPDTVSDVAFSLNVTAEALEKALLGLDRGAVDQGTLEHLLKLSQTVTDASRRLQVLKGSVQ